MVDGIRTTNQALTENVLVRQVDDQISLLEPNETPLVTFLMQLKKRIPVYTPRFEWPEDDYVARWDALGASALVGDTTLTVTDATKYVPGDIFTLPVAVTSSAAAEVCRVTSVNTGANTIVVVRGLGGTTATGYSNGQSIRLLGSSAPEGDVPPVSKSTTMSLLTSYTQIFRTSVNLSKTQVASKLYGRPNGERKREQKKKLVEHKQKLNASALFGVPSENLNGTNGNPQRTTMGLSARIQSNLVNANGTLTMQEFETFSRAAFRYGSDTKLLLAAPLVISAIHDWGNSRLLIEPMAKVFGVDVEKVQTGHGVFLLARDWMLENGIAGQAGFAGEAFSIDLDSCLYFYLQGNGENRDTKLMENVIQDGRDAYVDEIVTEGGFAFKFEKKFARLFNVTGYTSVIS